jgi:catechol 2,3-dioxygenase-like lactoylglutathione lyase family enzyme
MKVKSITPNLLVSSVKESVEFYTEILGFKYVMGVDDNKELYLKYDKNQELGFAIVQNEINQIMFQEISNTNADLDLDLSIDKKITNAIIYIEIDGFDDFYEEIKDKTEIVNEPRHTFYGMKEFYIRDNSGNIVGFAERLV